MGAGGEKKPMPEIAETKAAARDEAFEAIIERIKSSGGEIVKDEMSPLYMEIGSQELEIGTQRVVECNLNKLDIQLTRNVETHAMSGSGHQKHADKLDMPRVKIKMKQKPDSSDTWQIVDLEDFA
ncbi:MAG: hypothetical protein GWP15_03755 [Nitrospirae bacterium]|nr:hypothetical protein [Nitrospirota bacterium]